MYDYGYLQLLTYFGIRLLWILLLFSLSLRWFPTAMTTVVCSTKLTRWVCKAFDRIVAFATSPNDVVVWRSWYPATHHLQYHHHSHHRHHNSSTPSNRCEPFRSNWLIWLKRKWRIAPASDSSHHVVVVTVAGDQSNRWSTSVDSWVANTFWQRCVPKIPQSGREFWLNYDRPSC